MKREEAKVMRGAEEMFEANRLGRHSLSPVTSLSAPGSGHKVSGESQEELTAKLWSMINQLVTI
ncbi:MAG: hypothetical protein F4X14_19850 [Caldilineaceae bacterium SB0661_bin_32]|uniref:Uncharacterized protein n=1 Tax=Caldilineaceae bacterium SB0661_bin_32 TaxID=2605255 RepID=A0A6B1DC69_9CHLR|nr:hypothetical protein [Caldilineaceae bacterium SB0661_bin_32]